MRTQRVIRPGSEAVYFLPPAGFINIADRTAADIPRPALQRQPFVIRDRAFRRDSRETQRWSDVVSRIRAHRGVWPATARSTRVGTGRSQAGPINCCQSIADVLVEDHLRHEFENIGSPTDTAPLNLEWRRGKVCAARQTTLADNSTIASSTSRLAKSLQ